MKQTPPGLVVFDTEDDSKELLAAGKSGFDKTVTQIAAIHENGERFHNRGNTAEFFKWLHKVKAADVWGFNTQYDIGNLVNAGKYRLDHWDLTLVKGRFIKAKIEGINFFDARNISGGSVKALGDAVGLKKLDFDAQGKAYVFRDCEIPLRWLMFVREQCAEMGIERIPATLGGLCVKAFTAGGGENWFEASEETAAAIRGARVELFSGGGRGRIAYVDINSLYPDCLTQLFPDCIETLPDLNGYGIADIQIRIPRNCRIAPLPVRDDAGRLLFPVGKLRGVWTIAEIKNAVRTCGAKVEKIFSIYGSKTGKPFYRDYILETYKKRLAAKSPAENLFWKLLMNNLYGRLAIGGEISRSLNLTDTNKDNPAGIPFGNKILMNHQMPLPEFTNYLHAAHVLSYARIKLHSYLLKIPADDLIYCDTDSVIFFCRGEIPFPVSKELGEMKLEAWGKRCTPILPKMYIFDDTHKAKGVPKNQAKTFIETGRAEYESPFKMREAIRFYDAENIRKLSVWRKVEKIKSAEYDKKRISGKFFLPPLMKMY